MVVEKLDIHMQKMNVDPYLYHMQKLTQNESDLKARTQTMRLRRKHR